LTRVFGRGELKSAVLALVAEFGPVNGYAVMHGLTDRVGNGWTPSPGSVYPALLALEDLGLIAGKPVHGTRSYTLTAAGVVAARNAGSVFERAAGKAQLAPVALPTLGSVLDALATNTAHRALRVDETDVQHLEDRYQAFVEDITTYLQLHRGRDHG